VLTVVIEEALVRDVTLDVDIMLVAMLGARWDLVNLVEADLELWRLGAMVSRLFPFVIESLLRLIEFGIEGLVIRVGIMLSRERPGAKGSLFVLDVGLNGFNGPVGLANRLEVMSLRLFPSDMVVSIPVLRLARLLPARLGTTLDDAEFGELPK
jgi:hypothetical protein